MVHHILVVRPVLIVRMVINILVRPDIAVLIQVIIVVIIIHARPELIQPAVPPVALPIRLQIVLVSQLLQMYVLHALQVILGERDIMPVHILVSVWL